MKTIPKPTLILGYQEFFNEPPPSERLSILNGICKRNLIAEFAGLNYRLKPKNVYFYDTSLHTQIKELEYFCGIDRTLLKFYSAVAERYTANPKDYPLIFTRPTCLFALEEIIQSDLTVIEDFSMAKVDVWNSIFKYILAVNSRITSINQSSDEPVNFETLNSKMVPLSELALDTDPISIPFRAHSLYEFLSTNSDISSYFEDYLKINFGLTFEKFIYEILRMFLANKQDNSSLDFAYNVTRDQAPLFEALSSKFESKEIHKLLSIRKYPFFKSKENSFFLTDNIILLEKLYSQFINDFWFDYMKPVAKWNIKKYKAVIGYFFEQYVKGIINYAFKNAKHYVVKQFHELNVTFKGDLIEIADLYVRYNSKVILGQIKSTSIYDSEKFSGNIDQFYRNNRDAFFASFGVNQIIKSIKLMNDTMSNIDRAFPQNKLIKVFPVIIFNEKALQTPLMANVFQQRFLELMKDFKSNKIYVYPLSLIHISDLETIQDFLNNKPSGIWDLLKFHCRFHKFIPPFYNSINKKNIRPEHKRTIEIYQKLIPKFSGGQNGT